MCGDNMEHNRKQKLLMIIALVLLIASLSIGFAFFSVSLNISSQASVSPSSDTCSVKFSTNKDNLVVEPVTPSDNPYSLTTTNGIIDNSTNPTISNLSATFTEPGQYVEYTFYARNEGEYTAYLNSVNYFGEKTCDSSEDISSNVQSACDSIVLKVYVDDSEYLNTTEISNHALEKKTGEEIRVVIDYPSTGGWADSTFNVVFPNIMMIYSTIDDSTYIPDDSPLNYRLLSDIVKEGATSDSSVDFKSSAGLDVENNIAYVMNSTINDSNPIYYYRGNVTKNNVRFANFCWKMVRTTETGGIKLIYNGVPAEDGSCNNTGTASQLASTSAFNSSYNSPTYVGYMYGTVYTSISKSFSSQSETYVYGNDVNWDGTSYTLTDTTTSSSWATDYKTLATKYHYTCFNTTGTCTEVYYINYFGSASRVYFLTLKDGKDIEDAKEEMFANTTDSEIKTKIDSWYASNMTGYTNMLEDTVWCNDRTITSGTLYSKDANSTGSSYFGAYSRNGSSIDPSLTCPEKLDGFTVSSSKGNGSLIYPVGLLTADEYTLAGSGNKGYSTTSYLCTGEYQWSLSPYYFYYDCADEFTLNSSGRLDNAYVSYPRGVRPSVSLKLGTLISGGDGSVSTPYIVE